MPLLLAAFSALAYLLATALVVARLRLPSAPSDTAPAEAHLPGISVLGLVTHAALLQQTAWGDSGISLGLFDAASLIAWVALLALFLVALKRPLGYIGVLLLPLGAICALASVLWTGERPWSDPTNIGFQTHVTTSVTAYGVLLLAACQSLLVAFQQDRLAKRRPGGVLRVLPPLTTQESLLFQLLGVGFFLLSLSLASGLVFVDDLMVQHLAHKTLLATLAWVIFAVLLWGRWRRGWRGRTAMRLVLAGFITLVLAYFGSKIVLELLLDRPWFAS